MLTKLQLKFSFVLAIILCCVGMGYGQDLEKKLQVSVSVGAQEESLNWSIAGNSSGQNPNVLSELKWKNVASFNFSGELRWNVWNRVMIYGSYNRSRITSGDVSDIDYAGDNRTQSTYNQSFTDNKGNTNAWYAGAGYMIFNNSRFSLTPYVGYGINKQSFYILDNTGQFPDLNSSYFTRWKGPFIKITSSVQLINSLKIAADITYNQVNYNAQGDWNLISQFQHPISYTHMASGYGVNAGARLVYQIMPNVGVHIGYNYFNWQTGNGTDMLYLSSGQVDKTQMNGVYRKGYWVSGGFAFEL